ncbi:hypothetical protein NDU88_003323 [Pleurodeles waltl]|uniref:Uncharacterized protein n=1 Tax=Pleurodeles waltl TaxID=8319 RepID=A0AAV7UFU3_PLEWA|nr:hypothetical protein NDU88_003323 [Pleurodeles waltl]
MSGNGQGRLKLLYNHGRLVLRPGPKAQSAWPRQLRSCRPLLTLGLLHLAAQASGAVHVVSTLLYSSRGRSSALRPPRPRTLSSGASRGVTAKLSSRGCQRSATSSHGSPSPQIPIQATGEQRAPHSPLIKSN